MNHLVSPSWIEVIPPWFLFSVLGILGAVVGSFLNVCIHRIPRGDSIITPRSRCYSCGTMIRWFDNIPIVSYLVLHGKCRNCGSRFSIRYWLVEWITALLFVAVWMRFNFPESIVYTLFGCGLIVATFIDFEHYIIPNEITLGGIVLGLLFSGIIPSLQGEPFHGLGIFWSLMGAGAGYGTLWVVLELGKRVFGFRKVVLPKPSEVILTSEGMQMGQESESWSEIFLRPEDTLKLDATEVRRKDQVWEKASVRINSQEVQVNGDKFKLSELGELRAITQKIFIPREAMGFGDVKLLGAIGSFLGPAAIFFVILVSSLLGSIIGLIVMLVGRKGWGLKLPYGPYLAAAAIIWIFGGSEWMARYIEWITK